MSMTQLVNLRNGFLITIGLAIAMGLGMASYTSLVSKQTKKGLAISAGVLLILMLIAAEVYL
ncbi:MAG: hypothetical protein WBE76_11205 [Terracidiphilus sp.]